MINWKVRIKNKAFWLAVIPAVALVAQAVAAVFGYTIDLTTIVGKLQAVVNAVFALLVILGIVVDPTTEGIPDSQKSICRICFRYGGIWSCIFQLLHFLRHRRRNGNRKHLCRTTRCHQKSHQWQDGHYPGRRNLLTNRK